MAIRGIGAYFAIDDGNSSPFSLTPVSTYLDKITPNGNTPQLDGTTFQPGVAVPLKVNISGFSEKGYTLNGKWTPASETFFAAIEGLQGLRFEYGPEGASTGDLKISGVCNCTNYSGPDSSVDGITTFTVELSVTLRNANTTF